MPPPATRTPCPAAPQALAATHKKAGGAKSKDDKGKGPAAAAGSGAASNYDDGPFAQGLLSVMVSSKVGWCYMTSNANVWLCFMAMQNVLSGMSPRPPLFVICAELRRAAGVLPDAGDAGWHWRRWRRHSHRLGRRRRRGGCSGGGGRSRQWRRQWRGRRCGRGPGDGAPAASEGCDVRSNQQRLTIARAVRIGLVTLRLRFLLQSVTYPRARAAPYVTPQAEYNAAWENGEADQPRWV